MQTYDPSFPMASPGQVIRTYKEEEFRPRRAWNGLTIEEAFDLEREAYARIGDHPHFPSLIRYNESPYRLLLRDCGTSFDGLTIEPIFTPDLSKQIESILDTLETNCIVHLDIKRNNICYDEKTQRIALIDFDTVVLDEMPKSRRLKRHYRRFLCNPRKVQRDDFYRALSKFLPKKSRSV